jgi:hypothetical protein
MIKRGPLDHFKREAKKRRVPYQRMIRSLVDMYAERQEGKGGEFVGRDGETYRAVM